MESPANGVVKSLSEVQNSVSVAQQHDPPSTSGTPRPTRPPLRPSRNYVHGPSSMPHSASHHHSHGSKSIIHHQNTYVVNQKHSYLEGENADHEGLPSKSCIKQSFDDSKTCDSSVIFESDIDTSISGPSRRAVGNHSRSYCPSEVTFYASPQNSCYAATVYSEAKQSFTYTEISECGTSVDKSLANPILADSVLDL